MTTSLAPATAPPGGTVDIPLCRDLEWITGPEEMYGDSPIYVGNEMPIEEVMAQAQTMDGFVEAWIDREHNGWINVGFAHTDIEAAQEELTALFPDEGVVAVELPRTHSDLEAIQRRVAAALPPEYHAFNYHVLHGRVEVWVGILEDDRIARVAAAVGDEPVCVEGQDPETAIRPGPQRPEGEGWRYLAEFDTSTGRLHVVGHPDAYAPLWQGLGGTEAPPEVDFETHVVVGLEIGYSGSCRRTRLDGVSFGIDAVAFEVNTVTGQLVCNSDYNPRTYLVTLERDRLPEPPFTIGQLDWPSAAGTITDDLRIPGSTPGPIGEAPPPEPEVGIPGIIEVGFPWTALIDLSCGIESIGEVNRFHWRTEADVPDEWLAAANEDGLLQVSVLLTEGPQPTLTLEAGGRAVEFLPGDPLPNPCFDDRP
ncbi:MAG TPA: hypothetical protein VLB85_02275 [Acidimicrobiia bacterium]|nr:hypothetical protein [Acidimicrobiia bacterium]